MSASRNDHSNTLLRRKFPRFKAHRNVGLQFDGERIGKCLIMDVSITGARLFLRNLNEIPFAFKIVDGISQRTRRVHQTWANENLIGIQYDSPFETIGDLMHYDLSLHAICSSCGHSDWINLHSAAEKFGHNFIYTDNNLEKRLVCKHCKEKSAQFRLRTVNRNLLDLRHKHPPDFPEIHANITGARSSS